MTDANKPKMTTDPFRVVAHPGASSAALSDRFSRARRRDTAPELALRKELHRRGLRYRVVFPVPGRPRRTIDIAFTKARIAVFVDGCYWHGCPIHGTEPKANHDWWQRKFAANQARDADTDALLESAGWTVVRIWEHEPPAAAADRVQRALIEGGARRQPEPPQ